MAMLTGLKEGIDVWSKLARTENDDVKAYFKRVWKTCQRDSIGFFSDAEEQYKKPLNNQKLYTMKYNKTSKNWEISLFHAPSNS